MESKTGDLIRRNKKLFKLILEAVIQSYQSKWLKIKFQNTWIIEKKKQKKIKLVNKSTNKYTHILIWFGLFLNMEYLVKFSCQ